MLPQKKLQRLQMQLIDLLDQMVREQVGESLANTMHKIRRLAVERRAGLPDAESRLEQELSRLDDNQLRSVIRWLSLFLDLANLAEDHQRVLELRKRAVQAGRERVPRSESISAAIFHLKQQGFSAIDVQGWLNRLQIEPIFTAHPSEAKRRTTREVLRRIRTQLPYLEGIDAREAERAVLTDLTVLWQSDFVRPERPPVMSEVSRGLFFSATLWEAVPDVYRDLRQALADAYPQHHFEIPTVLVFGTWIGGDRDGHPFVTAEITREALARLRKTAIENHLRYCREMIRRIVMSDQQVPSDAALRQEVEESSSRWPDLARRLDPISRYETYRRFLKLIEYKLEGTLAAVTDREPGPAQYDSAEQFRNDLDRLRLSIFRHQGQRVAQGFLQGWLDLADTFGFHFEALDLRQNSAVHRRCLDEMFKQLGLANEPASDEQLRELLQQAVSRPIDREMLSPESREVFDTFRLVAEESARWGMRQFGAYIISMTHSALDVLIAQWMWRVSWQSRFADAPLPSLPIVPLFETIDDLQRAPEIMTELFSTPDYIRHLQSSGSSQQMVMVGYSDSTKDGGYLSACWELHQAQERLAHLADKFHVELTIFHGRGGALGRGGGPAARAIRSLPPRAVNGRLRVTEQGEVLAERYDDSRIAMRHLEQLINATLLVSAQDDSQSPPAWGEAMSLMADASFRKYRSLVGHPDFITYFNLASPIGEIETLPIGSRPSRRGARRTLADLRAIPWTFAWTQSRHILPAWYGFGTAICEFAEGNEQRWSLLRTMYEKWQMFRALVDNAELALAKADMGIARRYADLVNDAAGAEIWKQIAEEFERSRGSVLLVTGRMDLLSGTEWLKTSIQNRNPYVDPLNFTQIQLLQRQRSGDESPALVDLLRLTIQGIASGLRTTG